MADTSKPSKALSTEEEIKHNVAKVLHCVEIVTSFASIFIPLLDIVTTLVGTARKHLEEENKIKMLEKEFQQIDEKLESISVQNKKLLDQVQISEIDTNYGQYETNIKHQYRAFKNMMDRIRIDPEKRESYMEDFKQIYRNEKSLQNLLMYYGAITGDQGPFGRPLLKFYLKHYKKNKKMMEAKCNHLANLFYIGLIAQIAYMEIIGNDDESFRNEWNQKFIEIQTKMQEALDECNETE